MSPQALLSDGRMPLICVPLVARTRADLLADAALVVAKEPDVIEWRADYFDGIESNALVVSAGLALREITGKIPLIFTLRSSAEGGNPVSLSMQAMNELQLAVIDQLPFEFHDIEMRQSTTLIHDLVRKVQARGGKTILSAHDFQATPDNDALESLFLRAHELGADVAKIAVMPQSPDDVLRWLSVSQRVSQMLPIPIISMSMGSLGVMSRIFGGVFGSALTFASSAGASAPGQLPIEDLRAILNRLG
jgi:3-dehydroquinate dehydratase-1